MRRLFAIIAIIVGWGEGLLAFGKRIADMIGVAHIPHDLEDALIRMSEAPIALTISCLMIAIGCSAFLIWDEWIRPRPNLEKVIVQLNNFYSDSGTLLMRLAGASVSDNDYKKLQANIDQWSLNLERYVCQELGTAVKSRLLEISVNIPALGYRDDVATIFALTTMRKNLLEIIDELSSQIK